MSLEDKGNWGAQTHTEEDGYVSQRSHLAEHLVMTEAEIGLIQLQAKENQGLMAMTKRQERISEGAWPCQQLDLRLLQTIDFYCLSHQVCGTLLLQP